MVGYYRNMWPHHSHILAPLTELTDKKAFVWEDKHQQAFEQMKALITMDVLLVHPNYNKPFDIETDASDYQLSAVIKQDNRPIAFYTRKLNSAQKNYTTIKKELLSIVKTLKEFRSMLLGAPITIYTDHKNLTRKLSSFSTQRILRWRLLLEEFGYNYKYKEGSQNLVADTLSRVPTSCLVREKTTGLGEKNLISQPNQPQEP
jgi:RNase H-like domain found in reverse transcriptase